MTMGLACDSDGYDLRISQCSICGSRGCAKRDACAKGPVLAPGWLHRDVTRAAARVKQWETGEPTVYLREVDAGTDSACWIVCAKGDKGAVAFAPR